MKRTIIHLVCIATLAAAATAADVRISTDYPGANAIVEKIEGDTVTLAPDLRDTAGWWFYWNFSAEAPGHTVTFKFSGNDPIGTRGPAVSTDRGLTWTYMGAGAAADKSFKYTFAPDSKAVRFAFAIPYLQSDLDRFLARHKNDPHLSVDTLCLSRKKRPVERLQLGQLKARPRHLIMLTARHHACESIASYALEGMMARILEARGPARYLRDNTRILVIPFVDKDGVEDGDQGKNRKPRDHNRDYAGRSVHPETAAIRDYVPKWSQGRLTVFLDLHCPWIRGDYNEFIYMVGSSDPAIWAQQTKFARILENNITGPLPYKASNNLPFGKAWNTDANYSQGKSSTRWAAELPGIRLSTGIEIPYANMGSVTVTADAARDFGRDLADALAIYLQQSDSTENQ